MNFYVLTLFPEMIQEAVMTSITGRAITDEKISVKAINIRDYADNDYGQIDDYPYGGGAGMVMQAPPIYNAYQDIIKELGYKPRVIYMTPQGKTYEQSDAKSFAEEKDIVILCGHYEGVDERVLEEIVTDNISIGDYVLTGGELPALVVIDSITRLVPGVLNNDDSAVTESFEDGLLEHPQYTRPADFNGKEVPEILLSGNHAKIDEYRRQESLKRTYERRPDMLESADLSEKDRDFLDSIKSD
ncbi:MAG TPA: tRNA (guanosine(37)-N1)-methyltransferase TrmD [Eubacterium sp.]|nr:tRNA (guanosine(37)-N1)-methyltransferase TrmD [Eubacterium sp.]